MAKAIDLKLVYRDSKGVVVYRIFNIINSLIINKIKVLELHGNLKLMFKVRTSNRTQFIIFL